MKITFKIPVVQYRHVCVTYDGAKDLYKLFVDGEKVSSGSWAGDNPVAPVRYSNEYLRRKSKVFLQAQWSMLPWPGSGQCGRRISSQAVLVR